MKRVEVEFLDKYKELDRLCGNLFNVKNGVGEYIATMEKCEKAGMDKIPNWRNNYKSLKHLRWIRNKIAHEEESPCTKKDLEDLKLFIKMVKSEKDPISLLYFSKNKGAKKARQLYIVSAICFLLAGCIEIICSILNYFDNSQNYTFWLIIGIIMIIISVFEFLFIKKGSRK